MNEVNELTVEKPYKLRKLQASDLIPFAKIIGKIGIDEMISCYADEDFTELMVKLKNRKKLVNSGTDLDGQKSAEENLIEKFPAATDDSEEKNTEAIVLGAAVATRIANKILMKLDCCMDEVFAFLGSLSGLSKEEVSQLELDVFLQMIMDIIAENNMVNFIRAAKKFIE